ncbi:MAG: putative metal-binding motif-containing protein [Bradymonadaceae bacterium]|nr:putative metal-binding motif-containing protein [Lujinxingiaceae bacterium]
MSYLVCEGTTASCGCAACTDCSGEDRWYDVGPTYACCSGVAGACTCQNREFRVHYCAPDPLNTCAYNVTTTDILQTGCVDCSLTCEAGLCVGETCDPPTCDLSDGWYDVGAPTICCNGETQSCLCQAREQRDYACAGDVCQPTVIMTDTLYSSCSTCVDIIVEGCDPWGTCEFPDICSETGTEERVCYEAKCLVSVCAAEPAPESQACFGDPTGEECATSVCDPWSTCVYADLCATEGLRERDCTGGICGGGTCNINVVPEEETCIRTTGCSTVPCSPVCGGAELCWGGSCFDTCNTHPECPTFCFGIDADPSYNHCVVGDDPCALVSCAGGQLCHGGSCFDPCASDGECTPPYACFEDRCTDDPCAFVFCPIGDSVCWGGSCFDTCDTDGDCTPPTACFDGRCTEDACSGVACSEFEVCHGGSCFPKCDSDGDCTPPTVCFDSHHCADAACAGVSCSSLEVCFGGSCFPKCAASGDCTPPSVCFDSHHCAETACEGVLCPGEKACFGGDCFDSCESDIECPLPQRCFNKRCSDHPCQGVICAEFEACHEGQCVLSCDEDDQCNPNHHCFLGFCTQDSCDTPNPVACHAGEVCHDGSCFTKCDADGKCSPPNICFNGLYCAPNSCAAKIDYDEDHLYRRMGNRWPTIVQRSSPWLRPRPIELTGPVADMAINIQARLLTLIGSTPKGGARIVLFAHPGSSGTPARYAIALLHGKNSADQGDAGATYSIRYGESTPTPTVFSQGAVTRTLTSGDFDHHQIQIETSDALGKVAGVALVSLPSTQDWDVYLNAAFRGDINRFEVYSAEGEDWHTLDMREEVLIRNVPLDYYDVGNNLNIVKLSEEVGIGSCQPATSGAGAHGICARGTVTNCKGGRLICDQTVAAWGYEVCDNRDNNCNGQVDEASAMRFPMVNVRHSDNATWQRWPTVDQSARTANFINYSPHGADVWEGSTAAMRLEDPSVALQAVNRSLLFFHRDLRNGIISMPMLHGARMSGPEAAGSPDSVRVEAQFEFDNELTANFDSSDLMFVSWYDDWAPAGPTRDFVPKTVKYDEYKLEWNVRNWPADSLTQRESDSAILQFVWLQGGNLRPLRFDLDINLPTSTLGDWRLYAPYWTLRGMDPSKKLEVRIEHVAAVDSLCMSNTEFEGCRATHYICQAGGITHCPTPTDETCSGCRDVDGDGYDGISETCPEGDDCNDNDALINPGATEVCDGTDRNCDGVVDGLAAIHCPGGQANCGPAMCEYRNACSCPSGPGSCFCSSALFEDTSAEQSVEEAAPGATTSQSSEPPAPAEASSTTPGAACATSSSGSMPVGVPASLLMMLVGWMVWRRRDG